MTFTVTYHCRYIISHEDVMNVGRCCFTFEEQRDWRRAIVNMRAGEWQRDGGLLDGVWLPYHGHYVICRI